MRLERKLRRSGPRWALIVSAMMLIVCSRVYGSVATSAEMDRVAKNWLTLVVHEKGAWAGSQTPVIAEATEIKTGDTLLALCYLVSPSGFIVVPALRELPPINAYSENGQLDVTQTEGMAGLIRDVLADRARLFIERYGGLNEAQPITGAVLLGREHGEQWDRFASESKAFEAALTSQSLGTMTGGVPLLATSWDQNAPYNNLCPDGNGGKCVVGCVATAAAQILKYWNWPAHGYGGTHSYLWSGDYSCPGSNTPGQQLSASYDDAYDWANMPNDCNSGCTQAQQNAVAELCYEVGVAFNMGYGRCASGAMIETIQQAFPGHFGFAADIRKESRSHYASAQSWFDLIRSEIEAARPMEYYITGHAIVCDGWQIAGGLNQFHMNYGWNNSATAWYTVDQISGSQDPQTEFAMVNIRPGLDTDGDGILVHLDNCPTLYNPGQEDGDGDGVGNVCDNCPAVANPDQADNDGDGKADACDNCPTMANAGQEDGDGDGKGNVCDNCPTIANSLQEDGDGDGKGNVCDNCPTIANSLQEDSDSDGKGNVCDNCPTNANPLQEDGDGDGIGNVCDNCSTISNLGQEDRDSDGKGDVCDNCPNKANSNQSDIDGDGYGDVCEPVIVVDAATGNDVTGLGNDAHPFATIQKGIDFANHYAIVQVKPGTYSGSGNYNLHYDGKRITVQSTGGAAATIIDCQGMGRGVRFDQNETNSSKLVGFTIQNGNSSGLSVNKGGGLYITGAPTIQNCIIRNCQAADGGGIYTDDADTTSPTKLYSLQVYDNSASNNGGGVFVGGGKTRLISCTISDNSAAVGAGVYIAATCLLLNFEQNIVSYNTSDGVYLGVTWPNLRPSCNYFWENPGGHLSGLCSFPDCLDIYSLNGDPMFCNRPTHDYRIQSASPCNGTYSPHNELIGACDVGCSNLPNWQVEIGTNRDFYMGRPSSVPVYITPPSSGASLGSFDLSIKWNPSVLSFQTIDTAGSLLSQCDWDYWTYIINSYPLQHVRVIASAGASNPNPIGCISGRATLYRLKCLPADEQYLDGDFFPMEFYWPNPAPNQNVCAVNTFKDQSLTTVYSADHVYGAYTGEIAPGTPDLAPPAQCTPAAAPLVDFHSGYVQLQSLWNSSATGDVNANYIRFDYGDDLLFHCYFFEGLSCFTENVARQIEATDVNCDGITLTVADYTQFGRIYRGDIWPGCPQKAPVEKTTSVSSDTLKLISTSANPGQANKAIEIYLANRVDLAGLQARFTFNQSAMVPVADTAADYTNGVKFEVSGRTGSYSSQGSIIVRNPETGVLLVNFVPDDALQSIIPAGSGAVLRVYFNIPTRAPLGLQAYGPANSGYDVNLLATTEAVACSPTLTPGSIRIFKSIPNPSCPVLYRYSDGEYVAENPLLTACEESGYKDVVTDYYHISEPMTVDGGRVRLQLRELEDEITHLEDVRLISVDHKVESSIAVSADGSIVAHAGTIAPLSAYDQDGIDRLDQVKAVDGNTFAATKPGYLVLTFPYSTFAQKGIITNTALKVSCPIEQPEGIVDPVSIHAGGNPLTVELLLEDGTWMKVGSLPSRESSRPETVIFDYAQLSSGGNVTIRITWTDSYSTDAVTQFAPSGETPLVQEWTPTYQQVLTSDGNPKPTKSPEGYTTVTLTKGEVLDLEFRVNSAGANSVRDFVVVAKGRYEPDYSVYSDLLPKDIALFANYPNPFNPTTTIGFSVPQAAKVRLEIFNVLGEKVETILDADLPAGYQKVEWSAASLPSGVYFYRLTAGDKVQTRKMLLLK